MRRLGLEGKVALITGGGRGIGRAVAVALASQGAKVAVLGRNPELLDETCTLARAAGGEALSLVADMGDPHSVVAAHERLTSHWGDAEVLVHNAARFSRRLRLAQYAPEDWTESMNVNFRGVIQLNGLVLPAMKRRRWGRVVFIGSLVASVGARGNGLYSTLKAAQEAMARGLALDYGPFGVTSNVVAPGFIDTERFREIATAEMAARHAEGSALKRLGRPEEVADAVVFLASEAASFITGTVLPVGGGSHLNNQW